MFRKILIANRGEIACRVAATARAMGVATVAVYSDADAEARHVAMADEAVRIGLAPVGESYLRIDAILDAAKSTGSEAIHPGYGFLSENPAFVDAVEAAGLVFIGPPASAIRAMGLKDAAKALMETAGVPVVPGYHGERQDIAFLEGEADAIGYPVLIKARAGGGGKGMRRVDQPRDFAAALESAQREAASSFGDPTCLVEKYVQRPRHVEIQVFADSQGNVVHLFERDCSLQRRHQKVIEEAPAPAMPPAVREAMGAAAVQAARTIGYVGAGTVEFIADGAEGLKPDGFWFMEMNTRLQVEHPVTEAITGLDLVALQLRVAVGEPLPFDQQDVAIDGHAVEARIYAEDPAKGFLPATGRLAHLRLPSDGAFTPAPVRVDSGVRAGDAVTPHYDPMIAKLVAHGPTRLEALRRLAAALDAAEVAGCVSNLDFLARLVRHDDFAAGDVDTGLIERGLETLIAPPEIDDATVALAAIAALDLAPSAAPAAIDPWARLVGWRAWGEARQSVTLACGGERFEQSVVILSASAAERRFRVEGGSEPLELALAAIAGGVRATIAGQSSTARLVAWEEAGMRRVAVFTPALVAFEVEDPLERQAEAAAAGGDTVSAPMPGLVKQVRVAPGADVAQGDPVIVLEAMKMEHVLTAPRAGVIAEVLVAEGEQTEDGAMLLTLAPETRDD